MEFKSITIKNFRNFEEASIELNNKNIFFGLNDVGKSNLIAAFKFIFDNDARKKGFQESDFHNFNNSSPIEITVKCEIGGEDDVEGSKLRARMSGAIRRTNAEVASGEGSNSDEIYIKIQGSFSENDNEIVIDFRWGSNIDDLIEISSRGYSYEIDKVFHVIYIDSHENFEYIFKKRIVNLIENKEIDKESRKKIKKDIDSINESIRTLSSIKEITDKINDAYNMFKKDNSKITIASEIIVNNIFSKITPYITKNDDDKLYPTAGEGLKKLLIYTFLNLWSKDYTNSKILLYFIEEPENHLHKSMQIELSNLFFKSNEDFKYLFITTHSSYILYEMSQVNLTRIASKQKKSLKVNTSVSSVFYQVPSEYNENKLKYNKYFVETLFSKTVFLVEGVSEEILFDAILSAKYNNYQAKGLLIFPVNGVDFYHYYRILKQLHINCYVKTDNDIQKTRKTTTNPNEKYAITGIRRALKLSELEYEITVQCFTDSSEKPYIEEKKKIFQDNHALIEELRNAHKIYISEVDLENDLFKLIPDKMKHILNTEMPVDFLQEAKCHNMVKLVHGLEICDFTELFTHYPFLNEMYETLN